MDHQPNAIYDGTDDDGPAQATLAALMLLFIIGNIVLVLL